MLNVILLSDVILSIMMNVAYFIVVLSGFYTYCRYA
jgi:hypothetical protein